MNAFEFSKWVIQTCTEYDFVHSIEILLLDEPVVKINGFLVWITRGDGICILLRLLRGIERSSPWIFGNFLRSLPENGIGGKKESRANIEGKERRRISGRGNGAVPV